MFIEDENPQVEDDMDDETMEEPTESDGASRLFIETTEEPSDESLSGENEEDSKEQHPLYVKVV